MSAYLIFDVEVHDPEPFGQFMQRVKPLVEAFGGTYLVRGGQFEVMEGDWHPSRLVLLEFPDMDRARGFVNSPGYAPLRKLRQSCANGHIVIVEGL